MMAVWYPSLESIPIPEQIVSQMGESGSLFGLHWYSCRLLVFDGKDGLSSCSIHKNRPSVCSRFQPASQGGYIHDVGQILFPECAYRKGISERTQMLRDVSIETDQNSLKEEQQILVKLHEKISFGQELTELEKQFISSLSKKI
jgi:Fe-S-cluster containining protein